MPVFHQSHRVTYAECTPGNHVYYGRYLELLEGARGEFFRHLGKTFLQWQEQDTVFPVVECRLRYHAAARYDEVLGLDLWVTEAVGARLNFGYCVRNQSPALILEAETFHACTTVGGKPRRLPADLLRSLHPFFAHPPPKPR